MLVNILIGHTFLPWTGYTLYFDIQRVDQTKIFQTGNKCDTEKKLHLIK